MSVTSDSSINGKEAGALDGRSIRTVCSTDVMLKRTACLLRAGVLNAPGRSFSIGCEGQSRGRMAKGSVHGSSLFRLASPHIESNRVVRAELSLWAAREGGR
jgi:hypothetical protein